MPYLKLLGTPLIADDDGPIAGPAAQHHRIALLALLAVAPAHTLSRDKLMALLWPERGTKKARNSLNVSVHQIRRALGREALLSLGDDLRLDPSRLECDVWRFEEALEAGDLERAVAEYGGPLLDGFHLEGSVAFSHRADRARERLGRAYAGALEALAAGAEERSEASEAAAWWRRRAASDPLSARVTVRLMEALAAAGDRAAALRRARRHAERLETELGAAPSPEVEALAERLRRAPPEAAPDRDRPPPGGEPAVTGPSEERGRSDPASSERGGDPASRTARPPIRRGVVVAAGLLLATLAVGAAIGGGGLEEESAAGPGLDASSRTVAVLPFAYRGSPEYAYLGEGMVDLLATKLDGLGELRSADPQAVAGVLSQDGREKAVADDPELAAGVAERLGAGRFVLGSVTEIGGRFRLRASLYDDESAAPRDVEVTAASEGSFLDGIDRLARRLFADQLDGAYQERTRLAALTTTSVPALRAYLRGEELYRAGRYLDAVEAYRRSIESDSSFALAHYGIAVSGSWWHVSDRLAAIDAAIERSSRLPLSERQLLRAHADWTLGRFREAERGYRAVLSRAPETVAAWYGLGEMLFHLGPLRGRPLTAAEEPFRRVLAFRPSHRASLYHAGLVAARGRSLNRLDTLIATAADHYAETSIVLRQLRAWRIFGSDDTAAQSSFLAEMERDGMLFAAAAAVEFQGELGHAVRILERFDRPRAPAPAQRAAVVAEAVALAGLGRWDAARRLLESERELAPVRFLEFEASIACSPWLPVPEEQLLDLRERVRRTSTGDFDEADPIVVIRSARLLPGSHVRPYLLGMLSARLGDHASALRQAERVAALPLTREYGSLALDLGHAVRGYSAYVNGNAEAARRELEAIEGRFPYIFLYGSVPGGLPHARFLRAKL